MGINDVSHGKIELFAKALDTTPAELVGYYSIAQKSFILTKGSVSNSLYKKLSQYGTYDNSIQKYIISSLLIGQLGKNYSSGNDTLISGDELLGLAIDKVRLIQNESGGRYTYLECEDTPKLISFYEKMVLHNLGNVILIVIRQILTVHISYNLLKNYNILCDIAHRKELIQCQEGKQ